MLDLCKLILGVKRRVRFAEPDLVDRASSEIEHAIENPARLRIRRARGFGLRTHNLYPTKNDRALV